MGGIEVQVTEQGPAKFEAVLVTPDGASVRLSREDRSEIQELAFREVLRTEVRPLPAGAIRVRVPMHADGFGARNEEVAHAVAQRILA
jgi:hypothetical protein